MKKPNYLRLVILLVISIISVNVYSQNTNSNNQANTDFIQLQEDLHGKFQIQMIGTRAQPAISQELLVEIKNRQSQSEKVFFDYKPNIRIMILSKEEVSNGNVISIEESIIYVN